MLNLLPPMIQHWLTSTIIIQNNWSILHTDEDLKKLFPPTTLYKREKCLKEILSPYFYLILIKLKVQSVVQNLSASTTKNPTISPDFLVRKFCGKAQFLHSFGRITRNYAETVCSRKIFTPGNQEKLRDFSQWRLLVEYIVLEVAYLLIIVVYIISCKNFGDHYVCSAPDIKTRFRIRKSDIKTTKDRCGTARYFNNKCCDSSNLHMFLQKQSIQSVQSDVRLEGINYGK